MFQRSTQFILFVGLAMLSSCNEPAQIESAHWCLTQPCLDFFGIIINQLSSSILVYALAFYSIYVAYKFYKTKGPHQSKMYLGLSLLFGGLGAFAAGTSFQAFGYEIKCRGKELCDITSCYEMVYNVLTVYSTYFILLGICVAFLNRKKIKPILFFGVIYSLAFTALSILGYQQNYYPILSFEFLLLYISPIYLSVFALLMRRHFNHPDEKTNKFLKSFLILFLTMLGYYIYLQLGIGELLWRSGIWFSANDILHIGMIGWLFYVSNYMIENVYDEGFENIYE